MILGAVAGGKNSLSCVRAVAVKGLLEERPFERSKEQFKQGLRSGACVSSTAYWTTWESFVAALLLASEAAVDLADTYMYVQRLGMLS